jgi:xanthine dehydrogenase accessory factor
MNMVESDTVLDKARSLKLAGKPFALATVVRCEAPTSAKPGAKAIVTPDGEIEGWIGGGCAQPAVIKTAKQTLQDGQPRLIRISPERSETPEAGIVDFGMTCHSGGTLDIFIEPVIARPVLLIIGASPVAQALCGLARRVGFSVTASFPDADKELFPEADRIVDNLDRLELPSGVPIFVVVSTQGKRDEAGLEAALTTGAEYIAFIASKRKAATLKEYLKERGYEGARVDAIAAPAGVAIGAVTPAEIALSVLADVVKARRAGLGAVAAPMTQPAIAAGARAPHAQEPAQAIDPICGMTVVTASAEHRSLYAGQTYYFCCAHCRHTFEKDPRKYAQARAT